MKTLQRCIAAALAAVALVCVVRIALAADGDTKNSVKVEQASSDDYVKTTITGVGPSGSSDSTVLIKHDMSPREKALEIANQINREPWNQKPGGGTKCTASAGKEGSTVTVTSNGSDGPVTALTIAAKTTGEKDFVAGKVQGTPGTGMFWFTGVVGTPGTVKVGIGLTEFNFDVSTFTSIGDLRDEVATTLTSNGFPAYVGPNGTIFATVPAAMDGVMMQVECQTMSAELVGYQGD